MKIARCQPEQLPERLARLLALCAVVLLSATATPAQASFVENFDNVGPTNSGQDGPQNLINLGWTFRNQSSPRGTTSWHNGYLPQVNPIWPAPQAGSGYLAVEGTSADYFGGRVGNWAILPRLSNQRAGDVLSFYAINLDSHNVPTLQVRYSPGGGRHGEDHATHLLGLEEAVAHTGDEHQRPRHAAGLCSGHEHADRHPVE